MTWFWNLEDFQTVTNTASSKRLHYVWTMLHKVGGTSAKRSSQFGDFAFGLHYFSHPMPTLYCFVIFVTPPYSARRRLPCPTPWKNSSNFGDLKPAIKVRCKSTKKISIKTYLLWESFEQTLNLTEINPIFTQISIILCIETPSCRRKKQMTDANITPVSKVVPLILSVRKLMSGLFQNNLLLCRMT